MSKIRFNNFYTCVLVFLSGVTIVYANDIREKPLKADKHTIALFHFDCKEGSRVIDSSKNKNHGRLFGIERKPLAYYGKGKFVFGVECCDSGWVDIPNKPYYVGMDKLTVEAWVFIYDPMETIGVLKSKLGEIVSTPGYTLRMTEDSETIEFVVHTKKGIVSVRSKPVEFEEWHHIAATYDGEECHIFLDGILADCKKTVSGKGRVISQRPAREADTQIDSSTTLRIYSPVTIGGGVNNINAVIDEVRISDCVRYKAEK